VVTTVGFCFEEKLLPSKYYFKNKVLNGWDFELKKTIYLLLFFIKEQQKYF